MPTEIIKEQEKMIYKMSRQFYGVEREDLIQAGFLGLTKAYQSFNPSFQTKFSTYAYPFIYGEMYEAATSNRPIKIKKAEMKIYKSVMQTKELLESKYEKTVTYQEACNYLQIDYQTFLAILNSLSSFKQVDEISLISPHENIDNLILLKESLEKLSDIERNVILNRYMSDLTQDETAKVLGLSQVKISRIEKNSREKIKNFVTS